MSDKNGTVIVTSPAWEGHSSPLGASLAHLADKYLVNVVQSPIMQLEMVNDAVRRAVLRELARLLFLGEIGLRTCICKVP